MAGRGKDFTLLGGADPAPGDTEVLEYMRTGFDDLAMSSTDVTADVDGLGLAVGTSEWSGDSADGFLRTLATTPPLVAAQGEAWTAVSGVIAGWATTLEGLQARADVLLALAEANEERRLQLVQARPAAVQALERARQALRDARDDEDGASDAERRAVERAAERLAEIDAGIAECEAEAARLRGEAAALLEEHEAAAAAVAEQLRAAIPPAPNLLPFGVAVAAAVADDLIPGFDAAGQDGIIDPGEFGELLLHVQGELLDPDHDLTDAALRATERMCEALARHEAAAGAVVEALGTDGVAASLTALQYLGQYQDAADHGDLADAILSMIGAASHSAAGSQTLVATVEDNGPFTAVLLATIEDLGTDLLVAIAEEVLPDQDFFLIPRRNEFFPSMGFGEHLATVLTALSSDPDAVQTYLDPGNADQLAERVRLLLDLDPHAHGVDEGVIGVLIAALHDSNADASTVAAALAQTIAADGAGHLDIQVALTVVLQSHLAELLENTGTMVEGFDRDQVTQLFTNLMDGADGAEVQVITDLVLGAAAQDAAVPDLANITSESTLSDLLKNELTDWVGPLQQALVANEMSIEEARAAITSSFTTGAGLVSSLIGLAGPSGAVAKLVTREVTKQVTEWIAESVASAVSPEEIAAPSVQQQTHAMVTGMLPLLIDNPDARTHMVDTGAVTLVGLDAVPADTDPGRVIDLGNGQVALVNEHVYETIFNDVRDAVEASR